MARYIGSACKQCRTEREKLFLKGERCSTKCALDRKRGKNAPGQHGAKKGKISDYGKHLREKQKARRVFGLTEQQFKRYFIVAEKMPGLTSDELLKLLEMRLQQLETEHKAIETELDSVSKVLKDNVENSFKTFA